MLAAQDRAQLDTIVQKMTADGQPPQNIQFVVNDYASKYDPTGLAHLSDIPNDIYGKYQEGWNKTGLPEVTGAVVGGAGALAGAVAAGIGNPIKNMIEQKPIFQDWGKDVAQNASTMFQNGYGVGSAAVPAATLGAFGAVPNLALGLSQAQRGYGDVQHGLAEGDTAKTVQGGLELGTGAVGSWNAMGQLPDVVANHGEGAFINPAAKAAINDPSFTQSLPGQITRPFSVTLQAPGNLVSGLGGLLGNAYRSIGPALSPMSKQTKAILSEPDTTTEDLNKYTQAGKASAQDPRLSTPLEMSAKATEDAFKSLNEQLRAAGKAKTAAIAGPLGDAAFNGLDEAKQYASTEIANRFGISTETDPESGEPMPVEGRIPNLSPSDQALTLKLWQRLNQLPDSPTLRQVNDVVDGLQSDLYGAKQNVFQPVNGRVEGLFKSVTSKLSSALSDQAGPEYSVPNSFYAQNADLRDWMNKQLGSEGNKGGALMKRVFSPSDAGTKENFAQIKALTGVDLIKEATLAKLAMDNSGDPRSASMLAQLNLLAPKSSILRALPNYVLDWLFNPERVAQGMVAGHTPSTGLLGQALKNQK
jgi:hypothetical protein